ncbi:MAG: tyrosine-type recombinase/integrase, partial [Clostridiales bacterium]|nr:tyrosine-type recombinase/integrase [Clostridiales bacterium]
EQHPDNPILFPSPRTGGYWSPDAVSRINRKLLKNAGIEEHVRFHDLRHTFATMAISSGVDVKTLSSMLGHFSAGFTLDTYTHITNDMQRGAAEKIGGFMESVTTANTPEPPDPPEQGQCKVIPFEKVG